MKHRKTVVIVMVMFTGFLSTFSFYVYQIIQAPNFQVEKKSIGFIIPKDATFRSVQDSLYKYEIVQDMVSFSFLAKLMGYTEAVKPGLYTIESNMTNMGAIRVLRSGSQTPTRISFSYARRVNDLFEILTRYIAMSPEEFETALNTFVNNNDEGFNADNIIAMFIPNTYEVYYTISPSALVKKLNQEYHKYWNNNRLELAAAIKLDPIEVSILASIVQAEASRDEESATIAGLYLNRIKQGIPLQADPTLVFASGDFSLKRVLNEHKAIDSPYNTYKYRGLPPGPINMPSVHSLDAVLNYARHNYIYMCAKEDFSGYHNFTASLQEHNENAKRYQRQLSIEQQKARKLNQN